ncbi:MAG: BamA/TamA family outer membrane protein [Verrucomicrobiota bacterium]|nr:BamA/TamA family outer membrane protein [Verrucomicrobiota bacterium]
MEKLLLFCPLALFSLSYEVEIAGVPQGPLLSALHDTSQLISLQDRPPASLYGLRYRMQEDIPELTKVLHAFAYYDAAVHMRLGTEEEPYHVVIDVDLGPPFLLGSYEVYHGDCKERAEIASCPDFSPQELGLHIGQAALSLDIVNAELNLLSQLARCGYPLAFVEKRRVEVDLKDKSVEAAACVQEGPLAHFGPATFFGLERTSPRFLESKLGWKEGEVYNADLVQETQERLLKSELFSSVYISHGEKLDEKGELPMKFRIQEARQQRIAVAASYGTVDGPGGSIAWTHRNVSGMGDILSGRGEGSYRYISGGLYYTRPDFPAFSLSMRVFGETFYENIRAYHSYIYRAAQFFDWSINEASSLSGGLKAEHINISQAAVNGTYLLFGLPFFIRYNNAENPINATKGFSLSYSITPYQSLFYSNQHFVKQKLTGNAYIPIDPWRKLVLALRLQLGSIAGGSFDAVPMIKRFLGGSLDDLRGYRYKTVSPLEDRKPLGGRSAIFSSAELRWYVTKTIGVVPFGDFGTVTLTQLPDFTARWFKSVGLGLRYYTFFGPIRLDVGFPLDRRRGIDPKFQVYATVGQTF